MRLMGITLPPIDAVLYTGAGVVVPPMVSGMLMNMVPETWRTSAATTWLIRGAAVLLPSMLVRQFISQRAGNYMLIGGAASLVIDAVRTFAPGVIPGLSGQPLLGAYFDRPTAGGRLLPYGRTRSGPTPMIANTPERLSPINRF